MILRTNGYANVLCGLLGVYLIPKEGGTEVYDLCVSNGSAKERETQPSQAVSSKVERVHFYPHMTRHTWPERQTIGPEGNVGTKMEKAMKNAKEIQTNTERHD